MTIKSKIRLSNILMVLIPAAVLVVAILIFRSTSLGSRWYSLEQMFQDENGIWSAQSFIYTYQQELWENNWGEDSQEPAQNGAINQTDTMYYLERKLAKMGYHIMVKKAGNVIYSNMDQEDIQTAWDIAGQGLSDTKMLTASRDNASVIKNSFIHDEKEFAIIAVNTGKEDCQVVSYLRSYIIRYVLLGLALFFALVVVVNWILSWWVSRSVLVPLKKLSQGTQRIRDGDLNTSMEYEKKDEFGPVCRDFEQMRIRLKELTEQRLENERRRREMINGVSHDLRTPLTSIGGYVEGLIDGIADTPEKQKRYFDAIKIRTGDLERLVDSLSEYSRLDSGQMKYHMTYGNLKEFICEYLETYQDEAKANRLEIRLDTEESDCPMLFDREGMKRVFDNLFTNTIRYRVKPVSQVKICLELSSDRKRLKVTYQDDGPGVPEESLERIFDTFYRTDQARSQSGKGSGLGLAVVREIIAGHGGAVWAENHGGLALIMEFPAGKENEA